MASFVCISRDETRVYASRAGYVAVHRHGVETEMKWFRQENAVCAFVGPSDRYLLACARFSLTSKICIWDLDDIGSAAQDLCALQPGMQFKGMRRSYYILHDCLQLYLHSGLQHRLQFSSAT